MKAASVIGLAVISLMSFAGSVVAEEKHDEGGYEMTTYVVGFLYRGPTWTPEPSEEVNRLQVGHMSHITKMVETGKLILAGPFMDDGDLRGLFVFKLDGESPEAMVAQAEAMVAADPMVKAGRLVVKFHPWYSAEGISIVRPAQN